jgi:hypothetical protein
MAFWKFSQAIFPRKLIYCIYSGIELIEVEMKYWNNAAHNHNETVIKKDDLDPT